MHALSAQSLLHIWEVGQGQHSVDRALTILTQAFPEMSWGALAALPIGQRDARLLTVHERTFGRQLAGLAHCPQCNEILEFAFGVSDIRLVSDVELTGDERHDLSSDGYQLRFRLPNSFDLGVIAAIPHLMAARQVLVQRCVLEAWHEGHPVAADRLPAPVIAALATQMAEYDPQADIEFKFTCLECNHQWLVLFDLVAFLWPKISAQAKRLLANVHRLARAYGWREADILSMSAVRRQFYLEMVS